VDGGAPEARSGPRKRLGAYGRDGEGCADGVERVPERPVVFGIRMFAPVPTRRSRAGSAVVTVALSAAAVAGMLCLASDVAPVPAAGGAVVRPWTMPTITETWSSGPLPDAGTPIAQSSPTPVTLGGQPSVIVGDRTGNFFAFELGNPTPATPPALATPVVAPGWSGAHTDAPVDSTPSVAPLGSGSSAVLVGAGNDAFPHVGGYRAFNTDGSLRWTTAVVNPPTDGDPAGAVFAGISVGVLQGAATSGPSAVAGSLGQVAYALDPSNGGVLVGWPYMNTDSTHATAALADLYGTGRDEVVEASDQSAGFADGQAYQNGGLLRVLSGTGNQVCRARTDQVLDSSPAVGGFLAGGATGIAVGTGAFFPGATTTDTVQVFDTRCRNVWSARLDGSTFSSPALSDVLGNGSLQVVEGTDNGTDGSVWALDGRTGATLWQTPLPGFRVIGSVTTADLFGQGYADVLVPTTDGMFVLDGRTGSIVVQLDGPGNGDLGLQNSPLVTVDPDGSVGITLAGYIGSNNSGRVDHFEIAGPAGSGATGPGTWPMFHHDPQLTGDAGGTPAVGSVPACSIPTAVLSGYDLVASDGGVSTYPLGIQPFCGSAAGQRLTRPVVGMTTAPSTGGYWLVASDGGVFAYGDAGFHGSAGGLTLNSPVVGMAATPDGGGYWLVGADGGVFAYGDAGYFGSMGGTHLNSPVVGVASTGDGGGYWLVAADGGVFAFGDAAYFGSMGGLALARPVVGLARDPDSGGYWEVASDGGVFSFGGAPFHGSTGSESLAAAVRGLAATANGSGYRFVAGDGGVFSFSAPFLGAASGQPLSGAVTGIAGS
jgi:hypothetical protein